MKYNYYSNLLNENERRIHFIGGGGKSTLIYRIAKSGIKSNKKVIITSLFPFLAPLDSTIVLIKDISAGRADICKELDHNGMIYLGRGYEKTHISGFTNADIEKILSTVACDHILVEYDSVEGRSLSDYKTVKFSVKSLPDRFINVIGSDAFNQVKSSSWLKTRDQYWAENPVLSPIHIAAWIKKHPLILKIKANNIPMTTFINKVENIFIENLSIPLAKNLKLMDMDRVFIGSVYNSYLFEVKQ